MNKIISLIATPLIVFILPADTLWLRNQSDLNYNLKLLFPFVGLFLVCLIIGYFFHRQSRHRPFVFLLWAYYLFGPFFLLYNFIRKGHVAFLETAGGVILFLVVFLLAVIILTRKFKPLSAVYLFSIFGSLLLIVEIYQFIDKYRPQEPPESTAVQQISPEVKDRKLPNIYHILFDEFQTERFSLTLSPEVKQELAGFIYFPENTTIYGRTNISLASIFQGQSYDLRSLQRDYLINAYNSESSILYWLKKAGYNIHFYLQPALYRDMNYKLIDSLTLHPQYAAVDDFKLLFPLFLKLWTYANFPACISKNVVDQKKIALLKNMNLLPESAVIMSYFSFLKFLNDEKDLPASNRYTYIHLIIPHIPYILSTDCTYSVDLEKTGALKQSKCASLLMVKFIKKLKELKRFDNSLIIISADHGSWHIIKNGKLVSLDKEDPYSLQRSWARSRALLLIKPAGDSDKKEMIVSNAESTLLDIAPTIAKSISLPTNIEFEGISLVNPIPLSLNRKRFYYFHGSYNPDALPNEITRYIIENNSINIDAKIEINIDGKIKINPHVKKGENKVDAND